MNKKSPLYRVSPDQVISLGKQVKIADKVKSCGMITEGQKMRISSNLCITIPN